MFLASLLCGPGALEKQCCGLSPDSRMRLEAVRGSQRNAITMTVLSCISISGTRSPLFTLGSVLCQPLSGRMRKTGRRQHVMSDPAERASQWQLCQLAHTSSLPPTTKAAFDNPTNIYREQFYTGTLYKSIQT